ncbi:hypothetical protein [Arachidicoccus sp.]
MGTDIHKILHIHPKDNVLVALQDLKAGEAIVFDGKTYIFYERHAAR